MPVTNLPSLVPLSSSWLLRDLCSHVRNLVNELDNARIQNSTIRANVRSAISHVADLLSTAKYPEYGITWGLTLECSTLPVPPNRLAQALRDPKTGFYWCNLRTLVTPIAPVTNQGEIGYAQPNNMNPGINAGVIPINLLSKIQSIQANRNWVTQTIMTHNVWKGHVTELHIDELAALYNNYNTQYRQSICYSLHGSELYFFFGDTIGVFQNGENIYELPQTFTLFGYRKPILDNLLPEDDPASSWNALVDIPDEHIRLVQLVAQKMCLEQLNKMVPESLDSNVNQLTQALTQQLQADMQIDAAERQKVRKGFSTR